MVNNQVTLIGRLTADLKLEKTRTDKSVAKFTLAVQRTKEVADFIRVTAWEQKAEFLSKYAGKGDMVGISGRIETRSWEDNGVRQYATDIVASDVTILSHATKQISEGDRLFEAVENSAQNAHNSASAPFEITDDDLPF